MKEKIIFLKNKLGIDLAIALTSLTRIFQAVGGVITVFLVVTLLNGLEQGFYYTFASILAIQVFFELGLNGIITQFVAHEISHLNILENSFEGNEANLSRLASLLHFTIKWFSIVSFFVFFVLWAIGFLFFSFYYKSNIHIEWHFPWILLSLGASLNFLISPILAFIEGLGKVKEVAKIRLIHQLVGIVVLWSGLGLNFKLYVGGLSSVIGFVVLLFFTLKVFKPILINIYNVKINEIISYRLEIFPLQWKIAISWIGGYFIFQLFNPVLFATEGPIAAGQMGMTLTILNAVLGLSYAWVSTKIPNFSRYIAKKDFFQLDLAFQNTFLQSSFVNIFSVTLVFSLIFCFRYYNIVVQGKIIGDKFLPSFPLIFMMVSFFMNHIIGSWAVYLRCHKREPLLIHSVLYAFLSTISTILLGRYFGVFGITAGYCILSCIFAFWAYRIFIISKFEWH